MIRRREFITLLGGATAWSLAARAQQPAMPVIGYLGPASPNINNEQAFRNGLSESGYVEGRNVSIEHRWAEGRYDQLPALAADLVRLRVAVILASTTIAARAAKDATSTIPIVYVGASDPVQLGLVASLNRPDGNLTGFTSYSGGLEAKRVELLHELVPTASIGVLVNANNPIAESNVSEMQAAIRAQGREVLIQRLGSDRDFDAAFAALLQQRVGALLVATDPFFGSHRDQLVALAAGHSLPTMYVSREFVAAGGLISYNANTKDEYRGAGVYVGRILKGAKLAELPVQQPTIFELVINLKTAKALGITVPPSLLARADEVIE